MKTTCTCWKLTEEVIVKCLHQKRNVGSIKVNGKTPADFNGARISSPISIQPQGQSGTLGFQWPHLTFFGQNTWFRETSREPPLMYLSRDYPALCMEICFWMPHELLFWNKFANKHKWWRLLSGFGQNQTHNDVFYFSITICNGCNVQFLHYTNLHYNKPSP